MGSVKDWNRMLAELFGGMFFEARLKYENEHGKTESKIASVHDFGLSGADALDARYEKLQQGFYWTDAENAADTPGEDAFFEGAACFEKEEKEKSIFKTLLFYDENKMVNAPQGKNFEQEKDFYETRLFAFEEKSYGMPKGFFEPYLSTHVFDAYDAWERTLLPSREDALHEAVETDIYEKENERYIFKRSKKEAERVLNSAEPLKDGRMHEVNIEMVNNNNIQSSFDVDEALDMLSQRLCEIMAKSADGLYF